VERREQPRVEPVRGLEHRARVGALHRKLPPPPLDRHDGGALGDRVALADAVKVAVPGLDLFLE
jgi:hypothetical protein